MENPRYITPLDFQGLNLKDSDCDDYIFGWQWIQAENGNKYKFVTLEAALTKQQKGSPISIHPLDLIGCNGFKEQLSFTSLFSTKVKQLPDSTNCRVIVIEDIFKGQKPLHQGTVSPKDLCGTSDYYSELSDYFSCRFIKIEGTQYRGLTIEQSHNMKVALKTSTGYYLCAEKGGGDELNCNRTVQKEWETFHLIEVKEGKYNLKTFNGHYVCAEKGGGNIAVANRKVASTWETFQLEYVENNKVALKFGDFYMTAEKNGGSTVSVNRTKRDKWETFELIKL